MIDLADLTSALRGHLRVAVTVPAAQIDDMVVMESAREHLGGPGDLVLGISLDTVKRALAAVDRLADRGVPALVIRAPLASDVAVGSAAARRGLALVGLATNASWAHVIQLLREILDRAGTGEARAIGDDLYALADAAAVLVDAAVTIEDAHHRVLAYSSRDHRADAARVSTIVGRRVPPSVVRELRARGVFRRMTRSAEPFFLAAGANPELGGRFVVPVRAGGEWLGSIWCALDGPPTAPAAAELRAMAATVALHLLDRRAQSDVTRRLWLDRLRQALLEPSAEARAWLPPGPWRVVLLAGRPEVAPTPGQHLASTGIDSATGELTATKPRLPDDMGEQAADLAGVIPETGDRGVANVWDLWDEAPDLTSEIPGPSDRGVANVWAIALRRRGWQQPAVVEVAEHTFAIVTDSTEGTGAGRAASHPGQWVWLRAIAEELADTGAVLSAIAGTRVAIVEDLPRSRRFALDAAALPRDDNGRLATARRTGMVASADDLWAPVTIARSTRVLRNEPILGPLTALAGDDPAAVSDRHTLSAFLDHNGAPGQAAGALGIHVNTLRYRMARIATVLGADLTDPDVRLALQLLLRALA